MSTQVSSANDLRLRITEIFYSLQGESTTVGLPTVFVRLTGCPLRCGYCDTDYAFQGGQWMTLNAIVNEVVKYQCQYVTVTGGEPLAQPACLDLLKLLCEQSFYVSLETSGAIDVSNVDVRVIKVMDLKTPGSGESDRNLYDNVQYLHQHDQVKFVICSRNDYDWAKQIIDQYALRQRCEILMSPSYAQIDAAELADWILQDRLPVRFQLQLHKQLWGEAPGR
ncbi:7-carboxy-7-deazaguanine synthase QueE [Kaarinaea lacus]